MDRLRLLDLVRLIENYSGANMPSERRLSAIRSFAERAREILEAETDSTTVVAVVRGGVVEAVYSNDRELNVIIWDRDDEKENTPYRDQGETYAPCEYCANGGLEPLSELPADIRAWLDADRAASS